MSKNELRVVLVSQSPELVGTPAVPPEQVRDGPASS